jgi:methylamine dehydrogenase accessory protein MauD
MVTVLIVSQILSWIVILGLGIALLALARQVGVLHVRVAPAGALLTGKGPGGWRSRTGFGCHHPGGRALVHRQGAGQGPQAASAVVSPQCPLCKELIPIAKNFARTEKLDIVFVG